MFFAGSGRKALYLSLFSGLEKIQTSEKGRGAQNPTAWGSYAPLRRTSKGVAGSTFGSLAFLAELVWACTADGEDLGARGQRPAAREEQVRVVLANLRDVCDGRQAVALLDSNSLAVSCVTSKELCKTAAAVASGGLAEETGSCCDFGCK